MKKAVFAIAALAAVSFASAAPSYNENLRASYGKNPAAAPVFNQERTYPGLQEVQQNQLTNRNVKNDDSIKVRYVGEQTYSQADSGYTLLGYYDQH